MTRQTKQSSGMEESNTESVANISVGRRKLIKASVAAVPVVMTLQSGAAVAAASAFQCIGRNGEAPAAYIQLPKNADGTVNLNAHFGDKWCRAMVPNPANNNQVEMGLLYFDANGDKVGMGGQNGGGRPATQSCAVSFAW